MYFLLNMGDFPTSHVSELRGCNSRTILGVKKHPKKWLGLSHWAGCLIESPVNYDWTEQQWMVGKMSRFIYIYISKKPCICRFALFKLTLAFVKSASSYLYVFIGSLHFASTPWHSINYCTFKNDEELSIFEFEYEDDWLWVRMEYISMENPRTINNSVDYSVSKHHSVWSQLKTKHTVDGRNPAPVEVGSLSHYLPGFFTSQVVVWDFWTIYHLHLLLEP